MRASVAASLLLAVVATFASAQDPAAAASKLTVVIKPVKPFAFDQGGEPAGYSVDLWKRVAQEAGFSFELREVKTVPELIDALKNRTADVGVGALSATAEREAVIDFSQPIYDDSGLQILAPARSRSSVWSALHEFVSLDVLKVVGILLLALLAMGHLLWLAERRRNPDTFPAKYPDGFIEAAWWSVSTLITAGCENLAPLAIRGRLLGIAWMLTSLALVSTVTGSTAASFLQSRNLTLKGYDTIEDACAGLSKGEVKAVLYDAPILRYYLSANPGGSLQLVGDRFERHNYAFGLQPGSTYRKRINETLLRLRESGFFDELDKKWFASIGD